MLATPGSAAVVQEFPTVFLDGLADTIERFGLIRPDSAAVFAFSGGKDSLSLLLALRELGYHVSPVAVDMGYAEGWSETVRSLGEPHGLDISVVSATDPKWQSRLPVNGRQAVVGNLRTLRVLTSEQTTVTPCTYCYNTKLLALADYAVRSGVDTIIFGHHRTDSVASLLKSAIMYMDRWVNGHQRFERANYEKVLERVQSIVLAQEEAQWLDFTRRLADLVAEGFVGTDEPPRQHFRLFERDFQIVRPLFGVSERDTIAIQREFSLLTEGSGCGHGATLTSETPREMVQRRILWRLFEDQVLFSREAALSGIVERGLNPDGTATIDVRRDRAKILGVDYKPNGGCSEKY